MKNIIQNSINSHDKLSDLKTITRYFSTYTRFLVAGRLHGEEGTTLLFYDGSKDDLYLQQDTDGSSYFKFKKEINERPRFDVGRVDGLSEDYIGTWCRTSEFTIPEYSLPTLGHLLSLPAIGDTKEVIWSFLEGGLDEWLTCDCYDLDSEKVSKFDDEVSFEMIACKTTDYGKYGQILYRMIIRGEIVGMISTSGRYLVDITIYPTNLNVIKDFLKEIQDKCRTKASEDEDTWDFGLGYTDVSLDEDLLDAIASGGDLNVRL